MADGAYWFDTGTAAFITSTFYRPDLPAWVAGFNAKKLGDASAGKTWTFLDASSGPGHAMPAAVGAQLDVALYGSPYGNELLAAFAETAIEAERLGQRGVTDLLSVSFSSNDAVGHAYGPDSPEVRDMTVRTDRLLQTFFARVDALVGLDHTLVVLTADHGVAPLPELQVNESTIQLTLTQPFGPFLSMLPWWYVMNPKQVMANEVTGDLGQKWLTTNAAGSGPFKIKRWEPGTLYQLEAVPSYWKGWPSKDSVGGVIYKLVREASAQRAALIRGVA